MLITVGRQTGSSDPTTLIVFVMRSGDANDVVLESTIHRGMAIDKIQNRILTWHRSQPFASQQRVLNHKSEGKVTDETSRLDNSNIMTDQKQHVQHFLPS